MTGVLEDAQVYSGHAGKKELDVSDVKLAVQTRVDHSFTNPPPRDVCFLKHFVSDYCVFGAHCVLTHCLNPFMCEPDVSVSLGASCPMSNYTTSYLC